MYMSKRMAKIVVSAIVVMHQGDDDYAWYLLDFVRKSQHKADKQVKKEIKQIKYLWNRKDKYDDLDHEYWAELLQTRLLGSE